MANLTKEHRIAVKQIIRFVKGMLNVGLIYKGLERVFGYIDSSFIDDVRTSKLIGGYVFTLRGGAIS
jgi:hypothetical protein